MRATMNGGGGGSAGQIDGSHLAVADPSAPLGGTRDRVKPEPTATGTQAADRVADVFELFSHGPVLLGVSEVARELNVSKAVIHRVFRSLVGRRFLELDPETHTYRLGSAAAALGARALRDLDMVRAARGVLLRLRDDTNETATLTEFVGRARVYLEQFESRQAIRMSVELGRQHPLYAGGSGKAILAFLAEDVRDDILAHGLEPVTPATVTDPVALRAELATVVAQGYATSLGERQHDAGSVAAPIFDSRGAVIGSISVCGPLSRFDHRAIGLYVPKVCRAACEISAALGAVVIPPGVSQHG